VNDQFFAFPIPFPFPFPFPFPLLVRRGGETKPLSRPPSQTSERGFKFSVDLRGRYLTA